MVDKESLSLLFDLEMQAIGLLVLIVPFLALYYRNFLHWKNAPGHFHRDSPLKSPEFPILAVIVFVMMNVVLSPVAGVIFGWQFVAAYDMGVLICALAFIVYWALLTVYRYGDQGASYSRNTVSTNAAVSIPMSIITEEPQSYSEPVKSSVSASAIASDSDDFNADVVEICLDGD